MSPTTYTQVKEKLILLHDAKKKNEEEARGLLEILNTPLPDGSPALGLEGKLVDNDGFPLANVDIMQIRTYRNRLACLKTDRKALEKEIESMLQVLHSFPLDEIPDTSSSPPPVDNPVNSEKSPESTIKKSTNPYEDLVPFALVDDVSANSPAAAAGVSVGDRIMQFGSISCSSGSPAPELVQIALEVNRNIDKQLSVVVLRNNTVVELVLRPRAWEGRGNLGCHILPLA